MEDAEQRGTNYVEGLIRETDVSLTYLKKCVRCFEMSGLIRRVPRKNRKYVHLTEPGKQVAQCHRRMRALLNETRCTARNTDIDVGNGGEIRGKPLEQDNGTRAG